MSEAHTDRPHATVPTADLIVQRKSGASKKLSDVLPEPEDGTMVVLLDRDLDPFLVWRNNEEGLSGKGWFSRTTWDANTPMSWDAVTQDCLIAHVIPSAPTAWVSR